MIFRRARTESRSFLAGPERSLDFQAPARSYEPDGQSGSAALYPATDQTSEVGRIGFPRWGVTLDEENDDTVFVGIEIDYQHHLQYGCAYEEGANSRGRDCFRGGEVKAETMRSSTLADLKSGQHARVVDIAKESPVRRRLMELGFTPGAEVSLMAAAPMGDPLKFYLRGYRISMRKQDAAHVICE